MSKEEEAWKPGTIHLKTTTSDGFTSFTRHECWNVDRFVASAHEIATMEGGKAEQITADEFRTNTRRNQ